MQRRMYAECSVRLHRGELQCGFNANGQGDGHAVQQSHGRQGVYGQGVTRAQRFLDRDM
jgi:hypothetical protein